MRRSAILLAAVCWAALTAVPLVPAEAHAAVQAPSEPSSQAAGERSAEAPGAPSPHAQTAAPTVWATWLTRNVDIDLQNLPKEYSCDDLWYKVRGVLLAVGARQYMSIVPYACGPGAAGGGRSPNVQVKFQTLQMLTGAEIKWAETKAVRRVVYLRPGSPGKLAAGDCTLLSQIEEALFGYLGLHVVSADLACSDPRGERHYGVSVQALLAEPPPEPASAGK